MVQWTNLQRIEKFENLDINCKKDGGPCLVEPSLTAGWLADKIWVRLEILKLAADQNIQFSALFSQNTALFQQL